MGGEGWKQLTASIYMAFTKMPKWHKLAVLSIHFKIGLNFNLEKCRICNFLPKATFLPELQNAGNWILVYSRTSNHLDQCPKHSDGRVLLSLCVYKFIIIKPFRSGERWTFISQWLKFHVLIFLLSLSNPQVSIYSQKYTTLHLCAKCGDLKPTINQKQLTQIWSCF